jgi:dethiobiotin synthetase
LTWRARQGRSLALGNVSRETFHVKRLRVVVVGTGTEVGKTHVGCALLGAARARQLPAIGLKPIESGVDVAPGPDARALAKAGSEASLAPPYCLHDPISPHLAARRAGVEIDLPAVVLWIAKHRAPLLVVETAGGLLSPLTSKETNLDLVRELHPDATVIVSLDRLGVLHDVAAVNLALKSAGLVARAIALNGVEQPDASSSTNAGELEALHGLPVVAFPRAGVESAPTVESATRLLDLVL